jgi:hypothetical protein
MLQYSAFQIEAMTFHVSKHLLNPHSAGIGLQGDATIKQVGCQTPGFILTAFPMNKQGYEVNPALGQPTFAKPNALTRLVNPTTEIAPFSLPCQTDMGGRFLAQNIIPTPGIQTAEDIHAAKFGIAN